MNKIAIRISLVVVLAVFIKWGWEDSLQASYKELNLGGASLSVELRQKLGQNMAVALLSGFRGIVADFIWIRAHTAWEDQVWYKMKEGIEVAVLLQPHSISFWDVGSWHFAWNASYGESTNPKYPSQAYRLKVQKDWIEAGRLFLEEGIRNNPESYQLYWSMGYLLQAKFNDPLASIPFFKKASTFPEAPLYVPRMIGHMYVKGGQDEEAWKWWKELYEQDHTAKPQQMWKKIAMWGAEAEEKLNLPPEKQYFLRQNYNPMENLRNGPLKKGSFLR